MLYLAVRLDYIDKSNFQKLKGNAEEISRMLSGFINSINKNP